MVASEERDWGDWYSAVELPHSALKRISLLCTMTCHDPLFLIFRQDWGNIGVLRRNSIGHKRSLPSLGGRCVPYAPNSGYNCAVLTP